MVRSRTHAPRFNGGQLLNKKTQIMYRQNKPGSETLKQYKAYVGETIEQKVKRITINKEPIKDSAPITYQERSEGVSAAHDIRTDRFDMALDAMDKVAATHRAKREMRIGEKTFDTMTGEQQEAFNKKFPKNKHAQAKNQGGGDQQSMSQ